ncbi:MAG TPA: alpha-hydroxy acid oxidase [Rhodanobacteraceae bacterium]|jgi:L-lactate dehydrogenase (cytochrome)|nr:alpha-hydroxy acid oxidase [Rhodanobacteraceae bacterium]
MSPITCIEDLRQLYRKRVPRMFVDYCESGSWTEATLRRNLDDFAKIQLHQRVAMGVEGGSTSATMLGESVALPVALAPVGMLGMQHADGEMLAAKAALDFGVPFTLSTMSICSIEDVAACVKRPFWFQLYVMRDHAFIERLIDRAKAAGCSALVLTLDLQVMGQRHRDLKNGLSTPPKPTLKNLANLALHPRWCAGMARTRRRQFGNIVGQVEGVSDMHSLSAWTAEQFDRGLDWDDVEWIKRRWGGKLIMKGVLDADDARRAVDCGADAVVVSNHGGRQLDGAPSSISVLPEIAQRIGRDCELWLDGGVRSGQDVLKAIALGARGVLIGRAFVYGLGALGGAGVTTALELIQRELDLTMVLCGVRSIAEIDRRVLHET